MVLWVAGISAHPKAFPKLIDKGKRDPQAADECGLRQTRGIQTHEMQLWSRIALWMKA
jgi:hypothetical protein